MVSAGVTADFLENLKRRRMKMATGEGREFPPAVSGGPTTAEDASMLEQIASEMACAIDQIDSCRNRVGSFYHGLFGHEPETESDAAKVVSERAVEAVQPAMSIIAARIRDLHHSVAELSQNIDRLESKRLV